MTREQWNTALFCLIFWPLVASYGVGTVYLAAIIWWKMTAQLAFVVPEPMAFGAGLLSAVIIFACAIGLFRNILAVLWPEARDNRAANRSRAPGNTADGPPTNNTRGPDGRPIPPRGGSGVSPPPGTRRP